MDQDSFEACCSGDSFAAAHGRLPTAEEAEQIAPGHGDDVIWQARERLGADAAARVYQEARGGVDPLSLPLGHEYPSEVQARAEAARRAIVGPDHPVEHEVRFTDSVSADRREVCRGTEREAIEIFHGRIGPQWPVTFDGVPGHFTTTDGAPRFVAAS